MKTESIKFDQIERKWFLVDAKDHTLGRLSSKIAQIIRGKNITKVKATLFNASSTFCKHKLKSKAPNNWRGSIILPPCPQCEIVFISEAAYVYHKESIGSISKNETYNIDISRIPAGKYLVTIKNGKTYTTPQKLIIL